MTVVKPSYETDLIIIKKKSYKWKKIIKPSIIMFSNITGYPNIINMLAHVSLWCCRIIIYKHILIHFRPQSNSAPLFLSKNKQMFDPSPSDYIRYAKFLVNYFVGQMKFLYIHCRFLSRSL